jgi:hypothetical protein
LRSLKAQQIESLQMLVWPGLSEATITAFATLQGLAVMLFDFERGACGKTPSFRPQFPLKIPILPMQHVQPVGYQPTVCAQLIDLGPARLAHHQAEMYLLACSRWHFTRAWL